MSQNIHKLRFYQEELILTKRNLINSGSVRLLKATQERIKYLDERVKELEKSAF